MAIPKSAFDRMNPQKMEVGGAPATAYETLVRSLMPQERTISEYQQTAEEELSPFVGSRAADRDYNQSQILFSAAKNFFDYGSTGEFGPAAGNFIGDVGAISKAATDAEKQRKLAIGTRSLASRDKDIDARRKIQLAIAQNKNSAKPFTASYGGKNYYHPTVDGVRAQLRADGVTETEIPKIGIYNMSVRPSGESADTEKFRVKLEGINQGVDGNIIFGKTVKEVKDNARDNYGLTSSELAKLDPKKIPTQSKDSLVDQGSGKKVVAYDPETKKTKTKVYSTEIEATEAYKDIINNGGNATLLDLKDNYKAVPVTVTNLVTGSKQTYPDRLQVPFAILNSQDFAVSENPQSLDVALQVTNALRPENKKVPSGEDTGLDPAYIGAVDTLTAPTETRTVRGEVDQPWFPRNAIKPRDMKVLRKSIENGNPLGELNDLPNVRDYLFQHDFSLYEKLLKNNGVDIENDPVHSNPKKLEADFERIAEADPRGLLSDTTKVTRNMLANLGFSGTFLTGLATAASAFDVPLTDSMESQVSINKSFKTINSIASSAGRILLNLNSGQKYTAVIDNLVKQFKLPSKGAFQGEQKFILELETNVNVFKQNIDGDMVRYNKAFNNPNSLNSAEIMADIQANLEQTIPLYLTYKTFLDAGMAAKAEEAVKPRGQVMDSLNNLLGSSADFMGQVANYTSETLEKINNRK